MTDEEKKLIQIESRIQAEYFVKFYDSVLFDKRLSSNEKVLLCFYIKVGGNRNYSWYGVKDIAELLGLNEKTIRTCNKTLRELGYIETVLRTVNTSHKIIVNPIPQINGFDIIRESNEGKNYREDEGKNSPCGKNYRSGAVKMPALVRENLPTNNNNIILSEEEELAAASVSEKNSLQGGWDYKSNQSDSYEEFEKDYLLAYNKITARTIMSINQIFKTGELRQEFMSMYENALIIKNAGYDYNTIINKILPDLDFSNPKAKYDFHDYFRVALRNSAEKLSKKASVSKPKKETVADEEALNKRLEEIKAEPKGDAFYRALARAKETMKRWENEDTKPRSDSEIQKDIENGRKKITKDEHEALLKKLSDGFAL